MRSSLTPTLRIALLAVLASLAPPQAATPSDSAAQLPTVSGPSLPLDASLVGLDATATTLGEVAPRPTLILYFSTSCPHCWNVAGEFQEVCEKLVEVGCVAIAKASSPIAQVRAFGETAGLTCSISVDLTGQFAASLGLDATPSVLYVDADGQLAFAADPFYRGASFAIERAVARSNGQDEQTLWQPDRYYGSRSCAECHQVAYDSWRLTPHTLATVRLPTAQEEACLGCHATAAGQPGGYTSKAATGHLRGVGCEACHGPAGGHRADGSVSPQEEVLQEEVLQEEVPAASQEEVPQEEVPAASQEEVPAASQEEVAASQEEVLQEEVPAASQEEVPAASQEAASQEEVPQEEVPAASQAASQEEVPAASQAASQAASSCGHCHDAAHSISRDFEGMLVAIDHHLIEGLSDEEATERRHAMIRQELPRPGLQPASGICVGSLACGLCHAEIYDSWVTGHHGPGHAENAIDTSLPCAPSPNGSVECEQCHGAGAAHLAGGLGGGPLPGLRRGHARECVVEPTCRRCHSRDADPDWSLPLGVEGIHGPRTD